MLTGGCFCGKLRYEASGQPFDQTLCHCSICRRTTGAPAVAWLSVRPADFRFTRGEPRLFRSSDGGTRRFCQDCGAQLTFQMQGLDEVDVTIASLDDPEAAPPADEIWTSTRIGWMDQINGLPRFAGGHAGG